MLDWASARCTRTVARSVPGAANPSAPSSNSIARGLFPDRSCMSAAVKRRRRASSGHEEGVIRSASSANSAAAAGAPRACAVVAAASRIAATSASGPDVASARWRARSSAEGTSFASRACSARLRPGVSRAATAEASSGCVKRIRSPSSSRMRVSSVSARPGIRVSDRLPIHESDRRLGQPRDHAGDVERVCAETARRASRRTSRSVGMGSSSPGASVPPPR